MIPWHKEIADKWSAGIAHMFLLHGNTGDTVDGANTVQTFLSGTFGLCLDRDIVILYDRSSGITFPLASHRSAFYKAIAMDTPEDDYDLPRDPSGALRLIERVLPLTKEGPNGARVPAIAVIISFAETIVPANDVSGMSGEDRTVLVTLQRWAREPEFIQIGPPVFLITENLAEINPFLRGASSRVEAIELPYPKLEERKAYVEALAEAQGVEVEDFGRAASMTAGLKRIHIEDIILRARLEGRVVDAELVKARKDEIVRAEFAEVLELMDPEYGFEVIGGMEYVKDFFRRNIINPIKDGNLRRVPLGVLLPGPPGTGKCIVGDTLVNTNKGLIPIKDVPKYYWVSPVDQTVDGLQVVGFSEDDQLLSTAKASHYYQLGEHETIKVMTKQGYEIEGTPEHPIIVLGIDLQLKFKKLRDIKETDYLAIKLGANTYGYDTSIDVDKAYLFGLLLGDGNLTTSNRIAFTSADEELRTFFKKYFISRYGKEPQQKGKYDLVIYDWKIKQDFVLRGIEPLLSNDKTVPVSILQAPKNIQVAFLQGLFDTDGYFGRYYFTYSSSSKMLFDQVSNMLLNIGIFHVKKAKIVGDDNRNHYCLYVSGSWLSQFNEIIGFRLMRKKNKIDTYLACKNGNNTNIDIIPEVSNILLRLRGKITIQQDRDYITGRMLPIDPEKIMGKVSKYLYDGIAKNRVSRNALEQILDYVTINGCDCAEVVTIRNFLKNNIFLSPVKSITHGCQEVYDLTVPGCHSFVANGVINHNTLLASAVAKESGLNCAALNLSKIFNQWVGSSERNLDKALSCLEALAPCLVIVDEIDQSGLNRQNSGDSGVSNRLFKRLLEFMSDTSHRGKIVFVGLTNRPDLLDPAIKRPGRFDKKIPILPPNEKERQEIFSVMLEKYDIPYAIDLRQAANQTEGYTGAEIEALVLKSLEVAEDAGSEAVKDGHLAHALEAYVPTTRDIQTQVRLALAECNDKDLLPPEYRNLLDERKDNKPAPVARTVRSLN